MLEVFTLLADWTAYRFLGLEPDTRLADAFHFFVEDTTKIFVLLTVIVFVMGLFRTVLSPEKHRQRLVATSAALVRRTSACDPKPTPGSEGRLVRFCSTDRHRSRTGQPCTSTNAVDPGSIRLSVSRKVSIAF
jgi:hypothetical protein